MMQVKQRHYPKGVRSQVQARGNHLYPMNSPVCSTVFPLIFADPSKHADVNADLFSYPSH